MTAKEIYPLRSTETRTILSDADLKASTHLMMKLGHLLENFDNNHHKLNFDPIPILKEISKMLERATDLFIKNDPDPLDDRHPHRTHPDSMLGNILKVIFKNDDFMTKLVVSYILARDNVELSIQGCRLLLACVPGLDSKVVFSEPDDFISRLYQWAGPEGTNETLQGYSMCLLAAALENTENASKFRMENASLVPFALNRLRELQARAYEEHKYLGATDFSQLNGTANDNGPSTSSKVKFEIPSITEEDKKENDIQPTTSSTETVTFSNNPPPPKKRKTEPCLSALHRSQSSRRVPSFHNLKNLDDSNSKWDILQPFLIGTQQVYPLSLATYQRFILQYLAACGEYQDLLLQVFEGNALELLLDYIDLEKSKDVRLTFDALKYLTSLLVHRKFAIEFIQKGGILALLRLPRTSLASVGVVTCFYYIAYNNDVMEMLCLMGDEIVDETIQYILWCLEHSHESGMASACMFFSQALYFKAILRRFDQYDGPRKLYNYISTLNLMQFTDMEFDLTDEQMHTSTQCVRGVCTTFKCYILAHIFVRVENYRKHYGQVLPCGLRFPELMQAVEIPDYKSMKPYEEISMACETIVLEMLRFTGITFRELQNLSTIGMVKMFLAVRVFSRDWMSCSAGLRNDMCSHAMDSLRMMLCQPSIHDELFALNNYGHQEFDGLTILLQTALGRWDEESSLRIAALSCIQRCVCVETECWKTIIQKMKSEEKNSVSKKPSKYELIMNRLETMWTEVRKADGIMSLIDLINCKTPLTEADSIRKLATNTLTGLARHPEVRQILTKLPLIAQSGLQILMREPVCSDKRDIHAAFCKEACQLLQVITGRKMVHDHQAKEIQSSEKSHRQWVVENTKVCFNQVELLQLIHDHLVKNKLDSVAAMLKTEAKLPDRPASRTHNTSILSKPLPSTGNNFTKLNDVNPALAPRTLESEIGGISARRPSQVPVFSSPIATRSHSTDDDVFATATLPRRYTTSGTFPKRLTISPARSKPRQIASGEEIKPYMDLNNIVTDYFRNQHSTCKNPVTTVPPFSLFYPHKCPERIIKEPIMKNMALRLMNQELMRPHQRVVSDWSNERTLFSKFRNIKTMHDTEESYTRAVFSVDDEHLIVGHFNGEVHWINIDSGADDGHTNCHGSALTNIHPSRDGSMILTSCAYSRPISALWRLGQTMDRAYVFREDTCVRFANTTMGRIIGTCREKATVYDTETNHVLDSYMTGIHGLQYEKNYASFSPDDKLIFNDGLLWDVKNKNSPVHSFDRLASRTKFGTFHPHGTQIIINGDIYDIRTFRLLHHVPELHNCKVVFNSTGNIMYASEIGSLHRPDFPDMIYSSLRSFDTLDYSALSTVEGRKPVIDISTSYHDQKVCIIEQIRPMMSDYMLQSSTQLRLIEVGRVRDAEDENDEEEEETREDHGDDSSDSEDDNNEEADEDARRESVFDALGRLEDESDSEHDDDDDDDSMGDFDFEAALNRIIRRQALRRRQRAALENNEEDVEDADEDGEEGDGEDEDEVDPDFDMDDAIDDLVNAVDEELNEQEMGSDDDEDDDDDDNESGSWRTASRVGSEDINLDDMDEDEAREVENNVEPPEEEEDVVEEPPPREDPVAAARRLYLARGLRGFRLGPRGARGARGFARGIRRRPNPMDVAEILEARVEEQRAQFMDAIAREGGEVVADLGGQDASNDSDNEMYHSEEEEINSVSTTALNPALRRRNRRRQDDDV